jgi:hypothetical protein
MRPASQRTARAERLESVFQLMARQHGAAAASQIHELGVTRSGLRHLVASGIVTECSFAVFTAPAAPHTWHQRAMVATLAHGVIALTHGAAARLHGVSGYHTYDGIDVLVARGARPRLDRRVSVHYTRADPAIISAELILRVRAIPIVDIGTTICQIAERVPPEQLRSAIIAAVATVPLSHRQRQLDQILAAVEFWSERGRHGPRRARRALGALGLGTQRPRTSAERSMRADQASTGSSI